MAPNDPVRIISFNEIIASPGLDVAVEDSLAYRVAEIERHLHGLRRRWGAAAVPSETNAILKGVDNPFVAVSGNDDWGAAVPICGTADDPVGGGNTKFDPDEIFVVDTDHATTYLLRLIYGAGTSAFAITAGHFSETQFITSAGPFSTGVPARIGMRRQDVGTKLWVQVWNVTNLSEVDFFWGCHGYEG